jgi:hypothetical protein
MPRPSLYTPIEKIRIGYTDGQEFVTLSSREEYTGFYHVYPNGSAYSERTYDASRSVELLDVSTAYFTNANNKQYTDIKRVYYDKYIAPVYYLPNPTADEYRIGILSRYIVQKRNEPYIIIEVSKDQTDSINIMNRRGINGNLYRFKRIEWCITGPKEEVINSNLRILIGAEETIPGISRYLSDLTEFYK